MTADRLILRARDIIYLSARVYPHLIRTRFRSGIPISFFYVSIYIFVCPRKYRKQGKTKMHPLGASYGGNSFRSDTKKRHRQTKKSIG